MICLRFRKKLVEAAIKMQPDRRKELRKGKRILHLEALEAMKLEQYRGKPILAKKRLSAIRQLKIREARRRDRDAAAAGVRKDAAKWPQVIYGDDNAMYVGHKEQLKAFEQVINTRYNAPTTFTGILEPGPEVEVYFGFERFLAVLGGLNMKAMPGSSGLTGTMLKSLSLTAKHKLYLHLLKVANSGQRWSTGAWDELIASFIPKKGNSTRIEHFRPILMLEILQQVLLACLPGIASAVLCLSGDMNLG